jgi:hypothetical protein
MPYEQLDYNEPRKELSVYLLNHNKMESPDLSYSNASWIHQAVPTHGTDGRLTPTPDGMLVDGNRNTWW